jgi:DNA ligase (NAD+)
MKYSKTDIALIKKDPTKYAKNSSLVELVNFLTYANASYYKDNEPVIEDKIYDIMMFILKERDPNNKLHTKIGEFNDVNINSNSNSNSNENAIKLPYPMASLEKITELNDISKKLSNWCNKYKGPYIISEKLDGVSAQLIKYDDGTIKLYTRGDGTYGQDLSHLIKHLTTQEQLTNLEVGMSLRGEIVMPKAVMDKLKQKYSNGRSSISGLVGATSTNYNKNTAKYAKLVIYSIINPSNLTQYKMMKKIEKMNFECVWYKKIDIESIESNNPNEFEKILRKILNKRKDESKYDIDGIVCVDSSQSIIYKNTNKNPKHAFAFKIMFEDQIAETTIREILWEPSMYYYLNPTVIFDQVILKGSKITRATAHNAKYIKDNKIGIGTKIKIIKSGDVIPYILKIIKHSKKGLMPDIKYKWTESKVDIIATEPNDDILKSVLIRRNEHFFKTLKIKYISSSTIAKMYDKGYTDIYKIIGADQKALTDIEGLGEKSIQKIFTGIKTNIKKIKLYVLMAASLEFGRNFGKKRIKKITDIYPNILTIDNNNLLEKIKKIDGFSDITANQFIDNLDNFKTYFNKLNKYIDLSHFMIYDKPNKPNKPNKPIKILKQDNNKFSNEKIVFTGFRDEELQDTIIENGGTISSTVSKNTTIVIYVHNENKQKPNKLLQAFKLYESTGKPILFTKDQFIKHYKI